LQVSFEEGKLSEWNADDDHANRPKQRYQYDIQRYTYGGFFYIQGGKYEPAQVTAAASSQCEGAKDKQKLPPIYVPFFFKAIEHGRKSEAKYLFHPPKLAKRKWLSTY